MSRAAEAYKEKKRIRELLSAKKNGTITANAKKIEEKLQIGSEELPVKANERFNFSAPLHFAITRSKYFKTLENIITFEDLVEEIINNVDHGNLYQNASRTEPSKLACLIHKLFVSNITIENAKFLLNQYDSPYIRLAGVLYLRLGLDYGDLWDWLEPVLADYDLLYVDFEKQKQIKLGEIIEEISAANKLKDYLTKKKTKYSERKRLSIEITKKKCPVRKLLCFSQHDDIFFLKCCFNKFN